MSTVTTQRSAADHAAGGASPASTPGPGKDGFWARLSRRFDGVRHRMSGLRERVRALPGGTLAWRIGVTVVGVVVVIVGIILLPLPGPGWLIIFAGLGLLATEYDWAARLLRFARAKLTQWTERVRRKKG